MKSMATRINAIPRTAAPYRRATNVGQLGKPGTALYCRTARASREGIDAQLRMLSRYADGHGFGHTSAFIDNGQSGTHTDRPAFREMLAAVEAGRVNRILISDLSRLCRNAVLACELLSLFEKYGVELIAVKDGLNSGETGDRNLTHPFGAAFLDLFAKELGDKARQTEHHTA
jgi:DNA invertase Pin-like site-specific DNA recombinase